MFVGYDEDEVHEVLCIVSDMSCQLENIQLLYEVVVLDGVTVVVRMEELDELVIFLILQHVEEDEVVIVDDEVVHEAQQAIHELDSNVKELDEVEVLVVIDVPEVIHIRILFVDETDEIELHTPLNEPVRIMHDEDEVDEVRIDERIVMVDEDEVEVVMVLQQVPAHVEVEVEVLVMLLHLVLELDDYLYLGIQQIADII